ncbi:MAG: GIY-YIG nuclease family protein [Promethearchaeota archaeon]
MYYVYVILCRRGRKLSFYTGYTKNLKNRIKQHIEGKGARYLRGNKVKKLYYVEKYRTQRKAIQREREIKKFTHLEKKKLIERPFDCKLVENINNALELS